MWLSLLFAALLLFVLADFLLSHIRARQRGFKLIDLGFPFVYVVPKLLIYQPIIQGVRKNAKDAVVTKKKNFFFSFSSYSFLSI